MKSFIMAVAREHAGTWPVEQLRQFGQPYMTDPERWMVDMGEDWIAVVDDPSIVEDIEPGTLSRMQIWLGGTEFFLVEARTEAALRRYVEMLPDDKNLLIDNDHGWIADAQAYKRSIANNNDWLHTLA